MLNRLRDLLIDGILLALQLGATAYLLHKVWGLLREALAPVSHLLPNGHLLGFAALDLAALILLVVGLIGLGAFARAASGKRLARALEQVVLSKIPGYLVIKSIMADMSSGAHDMGMRPALVSFDDNAVLGFVVEEAQGGDMVTVFVPDAPASASGSVVLVERARVKLLDVATSAAMRTMKQRGLGLQQLMAPPAPP